MSNLSRKELDMLIAYLTWKIRQPTNWLSNREEVADMLEEAICRRELLKMIDNCDC